MRVGGAGTPQAPAAALAQLDAIYVDAIRRSAVVAPDDVLPLRPLVAGPDGTVTMTTWAYCRGEGGASKCGSYVPGRVTLKWDAWVVADDEFASACRALRGSLDVKVSQLLGLPAPRVALPDDNKERQFVTFAGVPIASMVHQSGDVVVADSGTGRSAGRLSVVAAWVHLQLGSRGEDALRRVGVRHPGKPASD